MGYPVSLIVANLYMEHFESIALSTAPIPPSLWFCYVDDTFVLTHEDDVDSLTSHINNIDDHIQFTTEPETQGKLPLPDLCVTVLDDACTKITTMQVVMLTSQPRKYPHSLEKQCIADLVEACRRGEDINEHLDQFDSSNNRHTM